MPAIDHIRYLAETVGPRGSTTSKEREAADYAAQVLRESGLDPSIESFASARSGWYPSAVFAGMMLVGVVGLWVGSRAGAALALVLAATALASVLRELAFRPNPLRAVLPKGHSQNVVARIAPSGPPDRRIIVMGHLDSHRTPLAFSSDGWVRVFGLLIPIGLVSSIALLLLFLGAAVYPAPFWRPLSIPFALVLLGTFLLAVQADFTPYTAGANDNASGAGVVLSLAEGLTREPLARTEVYVVLSGCEEVGCYGAEAFARSRLPHLAGSPWLTLDTLGTRMGQPCYLSQERFLLTARSDPAMLDLAGKVAERHPETRARAHHGFAGAYTESAIGFKYGFRVLTLISLDSQGRPTEWHRPTDVVDRLDLASVAACESFSLEFLREFDRAASSG